MSPTDVFRYSKIRSPSMHMEFYFLTQRTPPSLLARAPLEPGQSPPRYLNNVDQLPPLLYTPILPSTVTVY